MSALSAMQRAGERAVSTLNRMAILASQRDLGDAAIALHEAIYDAGCSIGEWRITFCDHEGVPRTDPFVTDGVPHRGRARDADCALTRLAHESLSYVQIRDLGSDWRACPEQNE